MTIEEASERYGIPVSILREYESWGLCGAVKKVMGAWQYDDEDLERLSLILTLRDVGFTSDEVETYLRLLLEEAGSGQERLRMLNAKRSAALDEIHFRERQLMRREVLRWFGPYAEGVQVRASGNLPYNMTQLARSGMGVFLSIELACSFDGLRFLPLRPALESGTVLAWKKTETRSAALAALVEAVRAAVAG